jgi:hypothetical protein
MRHLLQLAAVTAALAATTAHAQIINPDKLVAPPPPNPARHYPHKSTSADVQWLWKYTQPAPNGNLGGLLADSRFPTLLHDQLRAPQSFFRDGHAPLDEAATRYLGTQFSVTGTDNRYITATGCVPQNCVDQGMLFVDTLGTHPLVVFAATAWTTVGKPSEDPAADFNLWIFPGAALDPEHPPFALTQAISRWNSTAAQHIQTAILVDPDGTPHKVDPSTFGAMSLVDRPSNKN